MNGESLIKAISLLCQYLNSKAIPYVVVGGISVIAWGRTRTTEAIDLIIDHTSLDVQEFVHSLALTIILQT